MSKLRRLKKVLTNRQLPHCGMLRKIKKQTRLAQARKHRNKS